MRCLFREIQIGESNGAGSRVRALRRLRALARDSVRNAICISDEGAADVLAAVLMDGIVDRAVCEEAVGILAVLPLDEAAKKKVGQVSVLNTVAGLLVVNSDARNFDTAKEVGELPGDSDASGGLKVSKKKIEESLMNLNASNTKAPKKKDEELPEDSESSSLKVSKKKVGELEASNTKVAKKKGGELPLNMEVSSAKASKKNIGELPKASNVNASKKKFGELPLNSEAKNSKALGKKEEELHKSSTRSPESKEKVVELHKDSKASNEKVGELPKDSKASKKKVGELSMLSTGLLAGNLEPSNPYMAKKKVGELPVLPTMAGLQASNLEPSNPEVSISAAELVERLTSDERILSLMSTIDRLIPGLVTMVHDMAQARAVKAAVRALAALCDVQKNRARAVAAGIVNRLVAVLIEPDQGLDEACLCLLESLCRCAEGRAAVADNALAVPVIVKKMSRSSPLATEFAVGALWSVCWHCQSDTVAPYAAETGVCAKLFWLLQVDCTQKAKVKAGDLIRLIHKICRDCPCCYANACFENAGPLREE